MGLGWLRVYETGENISTNFLGGSCFAVRKEKALSAATDLLKNWNLSGGEDYYIGSKLGDGICLSGVYAYHFGNYTSEEWNMGSIADKILKNNPDLFGKYAKREVHDEK
jgi:hypothetical protein